MRVVFQKTLRFKSLFVLPSIIVLLEDDAVERVDHNLALLL